MSAQDGVADVLIVGAGASGAAVAWSLSQAGLSVVCLEQGGWVDPQSYPHSRPDWEHYRATDFAKDPNVRQRPEDYPINVDRTPIVPLMFNAVGGSTIHWSGHFPRFRPSDFRVHSLDDVAADWPLTYWDLEQYYEQNDAMIGVTGLSGDPANPPRQPRQSPPLGLDRAGEVYVRGLEKLGWHWWPSDCALITVQHGDGRSVCNNCGPCDMGCPIGAMSSAHVTYWPAALDQGVRPRDPCTGAGDYRRRRRSREWRGVLRPGWQRATAKRRGWWFWPATGSARPACSSTRPRPAFRTAWPTTAGWSAGT